MKRYKYQALVRLLAPHDGGSEAPLPGPACRMVVRARHRETGASKIFSALVTTSDDSPLPGNSHLIARLIVLGDDSGDYLTPGEGFVLWRGYDVGRGVVTPPNLRLTGGITHRSPGTPAAWPRALPVTPRFHPGPQPELRILGRPGKVLRRISAVPDVPHQAPSRCARIQPAVHGRTAAGSLASRSSAGSRSAALGLTARVAASGVTGWRSCEATVQGTADGLDGDSPQRRRKRADQAGR